MCYGPAKQGWPRRVPKACVPLPGGVNPFPNSVEQKSFLEATMRMLSTPKPLAVVFCIIAATATVSAQVSFAPVLRSGAISKFDGADAIIEGSTNGTSYTTV